MANIEKRGDKWRVRWHGVDGKHHHSATFTLKDEAKKHKRDVETAHEHGREWVPDRAAVAPLLEDGMTAYVLHLNEHRARKTAERHAYVLQKLQRYLDDARLADRTVAVLSRDMLRGFYGWLRKPATARHGKQRNLDTCAKDIEVVEIFWRWLADSDAFAATVPPVRRLGDLPEEPGEVKVAPTWAEMDAAIAHAHEWYVWLGVVLRFTGLRVQQAMALDVADVDLRGEALDVRGELGKSRQERRGRRVPLSPHLCALVQTLLDLGYLDPAGPLVPTIRRGERARQARAERFAAAWEAAGVRPAAWKRHPHHAFRAGFQSELKRAKGDVDATEYLVGHAMGGVRSAYIDPTALPLKETVALVPPLDVAAAARLIAMVAKKRGT